MDRARTPELRLDDVVRLLERHGEVPAGTQGRIIGRFARTTDRSYIVSFLGERPSVTDVRADQIVPAGDARTSG